MNRTFSVLSTLFKLCIELPAALLLFLANLAGLVVVLAMTVIGAMCALAALALPLALALLPILILLYLR